MDFLLHGGEDLESRSLQETCMARLMPHVKAALGDLVDYKAQSERALLETIAMVVDKVQERASGHVVPASTLPAPVSRNVVLVAPTPCVSAAT